MFDRDNDRLVKKYNQDGLAFLNTDNCIGMCLAVPEHRTETPNICIEHLYDDDALRTVVPNTQKRLRFMHEIGFLSDKKTAFLKPTPSVESLKIFDQDVGKLGNEDGTDKGNLAISKSAFFRDVVDSDIGNDFTLEGFRGTFERIRQALAGLE